VDDREARDRVARVETLLEEVEALADGPARATATELVQVLVELYGEGLSRIVAEVAARDDGTMAAALGEDEVVAHLLLLHGLHPVPVEQRVRGALEGVRPYLASHGGDVELLGVDDGVARLRLQGSCNGCPSSTVTLKLAIEDAIYKAAPDLDGIEAEGAPAPANGGLLQLEVSDSLRPAAPAWSDACAMGELPEAPVVRAVDGEPVLFVRLGRAAYAYRSGCPGCEASLGDGALSGAHLACGGCGRRYDVRHAGRCLDADDLHLEPIPLLVEAGDRLKIALGAPA
jgi:Fe-S cluster biogenesis protein NfuA/nitrite reductase/ring-hydroxylating ferredoxin subunit